MAGLRRIAADHPEMIRDVRGKGLMIGVQFDSGETAESVQWAAFKRGLLVLEAGEDVVRLSPPLVVTDQDVDTAVKLFGEAVGAVAANPTGAYHEARKWTEVPIVGG